MTATQSQYVIGGTNRAGVIQSGDTAMRLMSWDGGVRELQFACSPDGLLVARTVRLSSGVEVANSSGSPCTHVRLHYGDTADCAYRGDIALPSTETTQPFSLAVASGGDLWLTWGSGTSHRVWRYDGVVWTRYPGTGALSVPSIASYTIEADDGASNVLLCPSAALGEAVLRLDTSTATTTTACTVSAITTYVGASFNGIFMRTYGDGAGGLYVSFRDNAGPGAGHDGIYHVNSSGVVTSKDYSRVAGSGPSDQISRDVDGHWWEALTSTSLLHTFPDASTESFNPFALTDGFAISTASFPKRGPRCRPLVTAGMNFGLHVGPAGLA